MRYILALDQGTSSSRAILLNQAGTAVHAAQQSLPSFYPHPGWVEQNPDEVWDTQLSAAQAVLTQSNIDRDRIAGLGITNQRETCLIWERSTGHPINNAIVWQCRRTAPLCDELKRSGYGPMISEKTGLVVDPYFSATKVKWILDQVPGARAKAERGALCFGTVDCWLIYKLTGGRVHATDVSNASRTLLFNIHTLDWDEELLSLFQIPRGLLPEIKNSSHYYGETDPKIFGRSIPIAGNAGDQQAALFGHVALEPGQGKNTYGTGCFLLMNIGARPQLSKSGLLTTIGWGIHDQITYAMEGSVFIAGAAIQWLRDGLGIIATSGETEQLAASVESSEGVYFVPAFVGLGAPHWDMYARGAIFGLTRGIRREHIVRATLEAIAFQTRDALDAMERDTGIRLTELHVDGGAAQNNALMQIQADAIGRPIIRYADLETTAKGAAFLAGLGVGLWKTPAALKTISQKCDTFLPQMEPAKREAQYNGWKKAVERSTGWLECNEPTKNSR